MGHKLLPTSATLALTVLFALGLSLAPVPERFRPLPSLARGPVLPRLLALVLPQVHAGPRAPVAVEPGTELAVLPAAAPPAESAPLPLPPSVISELQTNGLTNLSAPALREALQLEALGEQLGTKGVPIELGCRKRSGTACVEHGLAPFFAALDALRGGKRDAPVRVVHLGDSLIASDHITDVVRARLAERHGGGGKGLLFIDRPTGAGRRVRAGAAGEGWTVTRITDQAPPLDRLGLMGVGFSAPAGPPLTASFEVEGARIAELFFLAQPGGGAVRLEADGKLLQRVLTRFAATEAAFARVRLPADAKRLTLRTEGAVELHGLSLESGQPGVVYDSIGLPGATADVLMRSSAPLFQAELRRRRPSLVVVMLGGNEAFRLSREWATEAEIRKEAERLVGFLREASPDSACLVMSPLDAAVRTVGGGLVPRRGSRVVANVLREVASAKGCAYWSALDAMGGEGAAVRWLARGMLNEDLVHPRTRGSDLLGHLFDVALARAFDAHHTPHVHAADRPGLFHAESALSKTFARMRALENGEPLRLGVLQLGASHTSSHHFSDAVRAALIPKLGDAGRGFVSAGKPSPRLKPSRVSRALHGEWVMTDALLAPPGGLWALTGTRATGAPGASLSIAFCEGCAASAAPAQLDLSFVEAPGRGEFEVRIDGLPMHHEPARSEEATGAEEVRILSFKVAGARHTIEVVNRGETPLSVLGAALELEGRGLVWDAIGLPGSMASTARGYAQPAFAEQLAARKPGLLVFWYGTNESALEGLEPVAFRQEYGALIADAREAADGAECLIIGPTDRLVKGPAGRWTEAPSLGHVLAALPTLAEEQGCAYWSARAAMGGERSMTRWQRRDPALGHPDGIHLTPLGYEQLAQSFVADLLDAYRVAASAGPLAEGR